MSVEKKPAMAWGELRAGVFTIVNLSPIDVGYGLLMVAALGLTMAGFGIAAAFLAVLIGNLVPALFPRSGRLLSGARPAQTLLIAEIIRSLGAAPDLVTVLAHTVACTVLAGAMMALFGALRLGSVVKYLPLSVLSGYINAVALLIFLPAGLMILGFSKTATLDDVLQGVNGLTVVGALTGAVIIWAMSQTQKWFAGWKYRDWIHWSVVGLFGGSLAFYAVGALWGVRLGGNLPELGMLLPPWPELAALAGRREGWGAILVTVFPYALTIAMLNSIESLVASAKHEELSQARNDPNQVLLAMGVANMVGGLVGALPIAPSISRVTISWDLGGRGFGSVAIGGAMVLLLMIAGAHLLHFVPLLVVGALMFYLAWTMIDEWTRRQIRASLQFKSLERALARQVKTNLFVMATVIVVALSGHLILAIFIGALLALGLFQRDYSRMVIGRTFTGAHRRSLLMRQEHESVLLDREGHRIHIVELNTPLVFGTSDRLADYLQNLSSTVRFLVLDMAHVSHLDDKGARYLVALVKQMRSRGGELHLAYVYPSGPRGAALDAAGLKPPLFPATHWHEDTDRALEWVEGRLLAAASMPEHHSMDLRTLDIMAGMSEDEISTLRDHMTSECYDAGGAVFSQGDPGDRLFILAMGRVEIYLHLEVGGEKTRRIAAFAPGVVFGEMALFGETVRSADAKALHESAVWILTDGALRLLEQSHPHVSAKFMRNVARQLSSRLAVTNDELVYATRN